MKAEWLILVILVSGFLFSLSGPMAGLRVLVVVGVLVAIAAVVVRGPLGTGARFMAKRHCSSFFLTGLVPEREFGIPIFRLLPLWTTYTNASAEVRLFGLLPVARAFFHGPQLGCVLDRPRPAVSCPTEEVGHLAPPPLPERRNAVAQAVAEQFLNAVLPNGEELHGRALLVAHRGALVAEAYRTPFGPDTLQHGWSMTKSLLGTLIGRRVAEGRLSLQDPVVFPNGTASAVLRVGHLLNMTSGLDWDEEYAPPGDPTEMLHNRDDMVAFVAARGQRHAPGTYWHYSSGDSNLLGWQLARSFPSACEHRSWVRRTLAAAGLPGAVVEADGVGSLVWSSYGWATPRQWLRWGTLLLESDWARQTSALVEASIHTGKKKPYAQHFWKPLRAADADEYSAEGFELQAVLVAPAEQLVVAQLACARGDNSHPHKDGHQTLLLAALRAALAQEPK